MCSTDQLQRPGEDSAVVEPDADILTRAARVVMANGVRLLMVYGDLAAIGVWSDLDGPHLRKAIAAFYFGKQYIPIRYLDGPNIPMKYKARKMKGTPVPLDIVAAMDKANAEGRPAWEVRDKMLAEIKWHPKVYVYDPG